MSKFLRLGCFLFLLVSLAAHAADEAQATVVSKSNDVVVIPIKGEITQTQFFFLRRALKDAEQKNASAVILLMDTFGGRLDAAEAMVDALSKVPIPTYTYINNNAGSAGALISLSTKKIYMAPVSAIGAAAPVTGSGEDIPTTMSDKVMSYFTGFYRSVAERNGHNPDIAEAFMNKEKEVKIGDQVIHAKGSVLSFSSQEAVRVINGKPVSLATGIADSIPDLLKKENLTGAIRNIEPMGFELIAFWVTRFSIIILGLGIVCAYLEMKLAGTLIPGICAGICFLVFFAGHYIAGLAGWEVFAVFFVGVLLLLSELMVHPGTILPGLAGALMIIGSLLWAMIDRYPTQPWIPTTEMLVRPALNLGAAMLVAVLLIYLLSQYLPRTSLFNRLVLGSAIPHGPSLSSTSIDSPSLVRVGETGVAKSNLRPSGKAEFGKAMMDVVTDGEFVAPETRVRVVAIEGPRIVVESVTT